MSERDPKSGQFLPGHAGVGGRPKGSRNKLGEKFLQDMYADWQQNGVSVIVAVRENKPDVYLKIVASLLPQQLEIEDSTFDGITDEQLSVLIAAARSALGIADEDGAGPTPTAH
jgi:hypothetical protein